MSCSCLVVVLYSASWTRRVPRPFPHQPWAATAVAEPALAAQVRCDASGYATANLAGREECVQMLLQPGLLSRRLKDSMRKTNITRKLGMGVRAGMHARPRLFLEICLTGLLADNPRHGTVDGQKNQRIFQTPVFPAPLHFRVGASRGTPEIGQNNPKDRCMFSMNSYCNFEMGGKGGQCGV